MKPLLPVALALMFQTMGLGAQVENSVELVWPECATPLFERSELVRALTVECAAAGFAIAPAADTRVILEVADCNPVVTELQLTIEFKASSRGKATLHTNLALNDTPRESRSRTIAVAIAELLRVSHLVVLPHEAEAARMRAPLPPASPTSSSLPVRNTEANVEVVAPVKNRGSLSYGIGTQVAWLADGQGPFLGGSALVGFAAFAHWRASGAFSLLHHSASSSFGSIDFTAMGGHAAWDRLICVQPVLALGPELSLTWVRALGHSQYGVAETARTLMYPGGSIRVTVEVPIVGALRLAASSKVGLALGQAVFHAGNQTAADFKGLQGGWMLGLIAQP